MNSFYGYRLIGYSFAVCFLVSAFFLHARGVFFPLWMTDFGISRTELSLAISLTLFTGSCFAPLTGYFIDRYPVRRIICIACLWLASGYLLMRWVDSYLLLLVVLLPFQGIGWTGVGPLVHSKLMVNWFMRHRGMALGVAIMGISVAGVFTPMINAYLAQSIGWRNSYLVFASLLLMVILPLTLALVRETPADVGQHPDGDAMGETPTIHPCAPGAQESIMTTYKEFLTSRAFWSVVLTFGLMNGVYSAMATHLPSYVTSEAGLDLYDGAFLLTVAGISAMGGKVVFGWMMDNISARVTVMTGVTAYLLSTMLLIFYDAYAWLVSASALFGLGFGGMIPVRSVLISRLFGAAKFSRVNGLLSFFIAPATFWVLITGFIVDSFGTYVAAFQVWFVCFIMAGMVSLWVRLPNRADAVA